MLIKINIFRRTNALSNLKPASWAKAAEYFHLFKSRKYIFVLFSRRWFAAAFNVFCGSSLNAINGPIYIQISGKIWQYFYHIRSAVAVREIRKIVFQHVPEGKIVGTLTINLTVACTFFYLPSQWILRRKR